MLIRLIEIKVRFSNILRFILFNEQPYNLTNSFSSLNCAPKQLSLSCNKAKKLDPNGLLFAKIHEIAVFCGILCINHATALSKNLRDASFFRNASSFVFRVFSTFSALMSASSAFKSSKNSGSMTL